MLYYTILYYTILYYTILYYTILYYTILYYTIRYVLSGLDPMPRQNNICFITAYACTEDNEADKAMTKDQ